MPVITHNGIKIEVAVHELAETLEALQQVPAEPIDDQWLADLECDLICSTVLDSFLESIFGELQEDEVDLSGDVDSNHRVLDFLDLFSGDDLPKVIKVDLSGIGSVNTRIGGDSPQRPVDPKVATNSRIGGDAPERPVDPR